MTFSLNSEANFTIQDSINSIESDIWEENADSVVENTTINAELITEEDEEDNYIYLPKSDEELGFLDWSSNPYLTHEHRIQQKSVERLRTQTQSNEIPFLIGILSLLIFSVFYYTNQHYFKNLFGVFRNPNLSQRQAKGMIEQDGRNNFILHLFSMFSIALYLFSIFRHYEFPLYLNEHPYMLIPGMTISIILIYLLKVSLQRFVAFVFDFGEIMNDYIFQILLTLRVLGIILIPFTIIIFFSNSLYMESIIYVSYFVIAITFLLRHLRSSFLYSYLWTLNKFHFILYLCSAELIPILILIKSFTLFNVGDFNPI